MDSSIPDSDSLRLSQLQARARELEIELTSVNSAIQQLVTRIAAFTTPREGTRVIFSQEPEVPAMLPPPSSSSVGEEPAVESPLPEIILPPLAPIDPLLSKWQLSVVPPDAGAFASPEQAEMLKKQRVMAIGGHLRLFGLLSNGKPWELNVPFSQIAENEGYVIGRDPTAADAVLPEPGVSRQHARLEITEGGLVISDLGSTNGVVVDGHKLSLYENQVPLKDGALLGLGEATLRLEIIK